MRYRTDRTFRPPVHWPPRWALISRALAAPAFLRRGTITLTATSNHLVDALPDDVRHRLLEAATTVSLAAKTVVSEPGETVRTVFFPLDCIVSVVKVMRNGTEIEVETIGREGFTGVQALLDGSPAGALSLVQIPGEALRVPFPVVAELFATSPAFEALVERYVSALLDAMAQTIACNRLHYVSERCARWLLTTYRRIERRDFALTHEALATMLGVRRAGVTIAAQGLQQAGWIAYSRGRFTIVDPEGLAGAACECHAAIDAAYAGRRLVPAS